MVVFWRSVAALLTAFLMWAAFPPAGETVDIAFALAPMLALSRASRPRAAAGWWFLSGFAFWFATLSWMPAICRNGGPWPLVALGWIALSAACAGYFALFGWLDSLAWRKAGEGGAFRRIAAAVFVEPALWAGIEWLRGTLFTGFAWNFLGTAAAGIPSLAAPARFGGAYLLSALVVMVNGVFATMLLRAIAPMAGRTAQPQGRGAKIARSLETFIPLSVVAAVLHFSRAAMPQTPPDAVFRVALIQRNAPCRFSERDAEEPFAAFSGLIDKAAPAKPDLILLAESAFAEFGPVRGDRASQAAAHFANRCGAKAVIGGGDDCAISNGTKRIYNAAALYSPYVEGAFVAAYRKQHLVPFGEYVFFDKIVTPLQKLSPIGVSLYPGEPAVFDAAGIRIAPLICFEDTVPSLSRQAAKDGAEAIALITNDSWFSGSAEARQHAAQSVLRAVETGLPVLRTGNSGVTGIVSPAGRVRWLSDGAGHPLVDQPGCQIESVGIRRNAPLTPYVRFGDGPMLAAFALALAACFGFRPQMRNLW